MVYWMVSLHLRNKRKEAVWELLQEKTNSGTLGTNFRLDVPELRVGTLDSLMALSDDLSKTSNMTEALVTKIRRQLIDVGGPTVLPTLKIDGISTDAYIQRFKWDEAKFPARRPLKETVEKMVDVVARMEDDLKVKASEYSSLKGLLSQQIRKVQGSLAVREISQLVQPQHVIETEHLTTLFVIVPKFSRKDWEESYERLCNYVVPRSSVLVAEDNDYALVTVVLFKRVLDDFKSGARSKGFQVREYNASADGKEMTSTQVDQMKRDMEQKKANLDQWCKTAYGEAFSIYMHMLVVRLFVESILRYGISPSFQAAIIRPQAKAEAKLRLELETAFGGVNTQFWKDNGSNLGSGLVGDTEPYPYVSLTLQTEYAG